MNLRVIMRSSLATITAAAMLSCGPKPEVTEQTLFGVYSHKTGYERNSSGEPRKFQSHFFVAAYENSGFVRIFYDVNIDGSMDQLDQLTFSVTNEGNESQYSAIWIKENSVPFLTSISEPDTLIVLDNTEKLNEIYQNMSKSKKFTYVKVDEIPKFVDNLLKSLK